MVTHVVEASLAPRIEDNNSGDGGGDGEGGEDGSEGEEFG